MLIKSHKRKKVFASLADINKNSLDTNHEFITEEVFYDEDIETSNEQYAYTFLLNVPIDKSSAVKNGAIKITGYVGEDVGELRIRNNALSGFDKGKIKHLNFALTNNERLARYHFKTKEKKSKITKVFGVDIASTLLADIDVNKIKDENISDDEIFGTQEVFIINSIRSELAIDMNLEKRISGLGHISYDSDVKDTSSITGFINNTNGNNANEEIIPYKTFKRKFNKNKKTGTDPASIIGNSSYTSQTLQQAILGQIPKDFKIKKSVDQEKIDDYFHRFATQIIPKTQKSAAIKRTNVSMRYECVEVKIVLNQTLIESLDTDKPEIIIFARDEKNRKIDYYTTSIDISKLYKQKKLIEQLLIRKNSRLMCQRDLNNKAIFKISNNSKEDLHSSLGSLRVDMSTSYYHNLPSNEGNYEIEKMRELVIKKGRLGNDNLLQVRLKNKYGDDFFDNTQFDYIRPKKSQYAQNSIVGIIAQTDGLVDTAGTRQSPVKIVVDNVPFDCLAVNVVKRNLTKKEKEFKLIKSLNTTGELFRLEDNMPIFVEGDDKVFSHSFYDEDVESGDTYEYKAKIMMDNCENKLSINSFILPYERRSGLIEISDAGAGNYTGTNNTSGNVTLDQKFKVRILIDQIDELFMSMDRNTYEIFSKDLDEIKDQIKKIVSCEVDIINVTTGDRRHVGLFNVNLDNSGEGELNVFVNDISDPLSNQVLIVNPRISTPTLLIENLLEKITLLPALQKTMPVSTFSRVLRRKVQNERADQSTPSKIISVQKIGKYTSKSVRFFGLILDPVTRFNLEKDDFFHEGSTGDTFSITVQDNQYFKKENANLSYTSFRDLTFKERYMGKGRKYRKAGVVNLNASKFESLVEFHAIYSKCNGTIKFLGSISPFPSVGSTYSFFIDIENEVGLVELFSITVLRDGTVSAPIKLTNLLCDVQSIRST